MPPLSANLQVTIVDEVEKDLASAVLPLSMVKTFVVRRGHFALDASVGRPEGARGLDPRRERLIHEAIKFFDSNSIRPRFRVLVEDINRRCNEELLPPLIGARLGAASSIFEGRKKPVPTTGADRDMAQMRLSDIPERPLQIVYFDHVKIEDCVFDKLYWRNRLSLADVGDRRQHAHGCGLSSLARAAIARFG